MSPEIYTPAIRPSISQYRGEFWHELRKRLYNVLVLGGINVAVWLYEIWSGPSERIALFAFHVAAVSLLLFVLFDYVRYRVIEIEGYAGLRAVYPVRRLQGSNRHDAGAHRRGVLAIHRILQKAEGDEIKLLLVSGYYYIGTAHRPGQLWDLLANRSGHVRILLLNPYEERFAREDDDGQYPARWQVPRRVKQATDSYDGVPNYVRELQDTVQAIKHLHKQNRKISVGFYNGQPRWQLFLTSNKAAIQIVSLNYWAEYGPILLFRYSEHSLYHHFRDAFDDMWSEWRDEHARHRDFYEALHIWDA